VNESSKAVLITGCSSGIGRSTAELLNDKGWTVYATARRPESIADLAEKGCKTLALDVTDEESMTAAVKAVTDAEGAVGVLINNAGYSQSGAVESVPLDQVRRQFETNVFGLTRMCQLVLPGMRDQRWGKIVNISSMGGRLVFPCVAFGYIIERSGRPPHPDTLMNQPGRCVADHADRCQSRLRG